MQTSLWRAPRERSAASMNTPSSSVDRGGLFRTADGKNFALTFVLISSLFLLWGFCNGMIDMLNKHFQDTLHINKEQSGLSLIHISEPTRLLSTSYAGVC